MNKQQYKMNKQQYNKFLEAINLKKVVEEPPQVIEYGFSIEQFKQLQSNVNPINEDTKIPPFSASLNKYIADTYKNFWQKGEMIIDITQGLDGVNNHKINARDTKYRLYNFANGYNFSKVKKYFFDSLYSFNEVIMSATKKTDYENGILNLFEDTCNVDDLTETIDESNFPNISILLTQIFGDHKEFAYMYINSVINVRPLACCPIIQSIQGLGKGMFKNLIGMMTSHKLVGEGPLSRITDKFNSTLMNTIFYGINELSKETFNKELNALKDLTGKIGNDPYIEIERKGSDLIRIKRCTNFIIFTNSCNYQNYLKDDSERRFIIIDKKKSLPLLEVIPNGDIDLFINNIENEIRLFKKFILDKTYTMTDILKMTSEMIKTNNISTEDEVLNAIYQGDVNELINYTEENVINITEKELELISGSNKIYSARALNEILTDLLKLDTKFKVQNLKRIKTSVFDRNKQNTDKILVSIDDFGNLVLKEPTKDVSYFRIVPKNLKGAK